MYNIGLCHCAEKYHQRSEFQYCNYEASEASFKIDVILRVIFITAKIILQTVVLTYYLFHYKVIIDLIVYIIVHAMGTLL